jgi:hypothetical protein
VDNGIDLLFLACEYRSIGDLLDDESVADHDEDENEVDEYTPEETFDGHLAGASVMLPRAAGEPLKAHVVARTQDVNGKKPIGGAPNNNPILDTRVYVVEFQDGVQDVATDLIAGDIYSQIDGEVNQHAPVRDIDHQQGSRVIGMGECN